jgi:hypothetical protein
MPTFVTFYAYAFEGAPEAPTRGWFNAPGLDHLVSTRARTALGRAVDEQVWIYRCHGTIEDPARPSDTKVDRPSARANVETEVWCDEAELIFDGNAGDSLWWFTMYCARSVLSKWNAPALVREYLMTGSPSLREVAHKCAWAASAELADLARLAARVAMYAAAEERPLLAAREACRLAGQIAGDRLSAVSALQERALASALLGATAAYRARLATEAPLPDAVDRVAASLRDSAPTVDEAPQRLSPTNLLAMG